MAGENGHIIGWRTVVTVAAPLAAVLVFYLNDRAALIGSIDHIDKAIREDVSLLRINTIQRYTDMGREMTEIRRVESVNHAKQDGLMATKARSLERMDKEILRLRDLTGNLSIRVGILEKQAGEKPATAIQAP